MKLAFVVQRYGKEILGGSETLARQLAERLSRRHEITVLTTTAKDYITWKNEYPPGEDKLRGVTVTRFPVEEERDLEAFNRFSEEIYASPSSRDQELEWLHRQGPVVPQLVEYLEKDQSRFDLLVFFTYLYYPTYYGLKVAPEKSVLIPTAHDEPPLRFSIYKEMFQLPTGFIFNAEAEEALVLDRFPIHKKMRETIGVGMELLDSPDPSTFRRRHEIPGRYLLYAGRIDGGKGLEELFRYFSFYKEEHPGSSNLQLVLIGKLGMALPGDASIRYAGFVDESDKLSAMAGAVAVMQPSRMESFSIVTLEAFAVGTPVVANAGSKVVVDHCRKADGGLYYQDFEEFEEILNLLLGDKNLGRTLGRNGQRYVRENYGWARLLPKYELALRASARPAREPKSARYQPAPAPAEAPEEASEETPETEPETAATSETEASPEPLQESPTELEDEPSDDVEDDDWLEGPEEETEELAASTEDVGEELEEGEEEKELETAEQPSGHLPSFYRSSIPPRVFPKEDPRPRPTPPEREPVPKAEEPPPPPPPEPGQPFELPAFYRAKPKPVPMPEEPVEGATEDRDEPQEAD